MANDKTPRYRTILPYVPKPSSLTEIGFEMIQDRLPKKKK